MEVEVAQVSHPFFPKICGFSSYILGFSCVCIITFFAHFNLLLIHILIKKYESFFYCINSRHYLHLIVLLKKRTNLNTDFMVVMQKNTRFLPSNEQHLFISVKSSKYGQKKRQIKIVHINGLCDRASVVCASTLNYVNVRDLFWNTKNVSVLLQGQSKNNFLSRMFSTWLVPGSYWNRIHSQSFSFFLLLSHYSLHAFLFSSKRKKKQLESYFLAFNEK